MDDVARSANRWCSERRLDRRIKDVALRGCIKERCKSTLIICDENCPKFRCGSGPDDPDAQLVRARGHSNPNDSTRITLCTSEKPARGGWGTTVIHEFAHTYQKSDGTLWRHGDGLGVPNDPGISLPSEARCYPAN